MRIGSHKALDSYGRKEATQILDRRLQIHARSNPFLCFLSGYTLGKKMELCVGPGLRAPLGEVHPTPSMGLIMGLLKSLHHQVKPPKKCINPNDFESPHPKPPDLSPTELRNMEIQPLSSSTMHTIFSKAIHTSSKTFSS